MKEVNKSRDKYCCGSVHHHINDLAGFPALLDGRAERKLQFVMTCLREDFEFRKIGEVA